ncbi:AEX-3 domain-containing protein [Scenedesmus sp. NREL 46B-D3]|nr:AEX-3 domain-containing protein [Scenedesmus sp. NREL 46B-D3]
MWFKLVVVGIRAGQKPAAEVFCNYSSCERPFHVNDEALAALCLPLGPESQTLKDRMAHEEYTFTLTQGDGTRVQGFCRRFLPPAPRVGSKLRYPQVLCLVCTGGGRTAAEARGQLLEQSSNKQLPLSSFAGQFLESLSAALAQQPELGSVIRPWRRAAAVVSGLTQLGSLPASLHNTSGGLCRGAGALSEGVLELQVPPDCGNGVSNAGVSLARLLWHVPVPAMLTLIASLLLERRVLLVGQSRDTVSAAVCAASALLYPFTWHHIYLPLLPRSLKDYLTAPMPFLIGMPAQLLPSLKGIPMDEVTLIDLDLGRCEPASGSPRDDAALLPWREQLEGALHAAFGLLRSPTEHESNKLITSIMQGYFLKLLGGYRSHIYADGSGPGSAAEAAAAAAAAASGSTAPWRSPRSMRSPRGTGTVGSHQQQQGRSRHGSARGDGGSGPHTPSSSMGQDEALRGHGFWFDHSGMVASHRRNERAQAFLSLLRQSQLYEVFIQERLRMAAGSLGGPEMSGHPFEGLVNSYLDNRSKRLAARLGSGVRSGISRFTAFVKKHRRSDSQQHSPGSALGGSSSAAGGFGGGGGLGMGSGFGGGLSGLADSPEVQRLKQLAAAFASAAVGAGQMRRNLTEGSSLGEPRHPSHAHRSSHQTIISLQLYCRQINSRCGNIRLMEQVAK